MDYMEGIPAHGLISVHVDDLRIGARLEVLRFFPMLCTFYIRLRILRFWDWMAQRDHLLRSSS
eukprot:4829331-Amphidinium_carterae.1